MKKIVFTEEFCQPENLFPFTLTRQVQDIRCGILTIREKWEAALGMPSFDKHEQDYKDLDRAIHLHEAVDDDVVYLIHGNVLPSAALVRRVLKLLPGECISCGGAESVVYCFTGKEAVRPNQIRISKSINLKDPVPEIRYPWDIAALNEIAIVFDYDLICAGRKSARIPATNSTSGKRIFIEEGARVEHCILNAEAGPIYIGKNALVMEGSLIRGPVAIGASAVVKMGTRIYGATTIGPYCTAGGEIKNAVLFDHSNKAHDGYLGDSVLGAWCNLGAGTSNSNLKNNASDVQVWTRQGLRNAGRKCGVFMGDYSRTAINTSINTGTVIGVCCNVFGNGLTPKFIPSFSWGSDGISRYRFEKALEDISSWKAFKGESLTQNETIILKHIFDHY